MKRINSKFCKMFFCATLVFISAVFCFGQAEISTLEFVGATDENPESQTLALEVGADAQVEVSNSRLIKAVLASGQETTNLVVSVNTAGVEISGEEGREFIEQITIKGAETFIVPIRIIIFPFIPRECRDKRTTVQVITRGTIDNFLGIEPTFPSPYLLAALPLQRRYDDLGTNKRYFGDSFQLGCRRVCGARVYVRARREGELDYNDSLSFVVSDAGNGTAYNPVSVAPAFSPMWTTGGPSVATFYREIPGSVLTPQIFSKNDPRLDIYSQDDSAIDYTRIFIWRY